MEKISKDFLEPSYTLIEVGKFLGFDSKERVRQKVKNGEITGFKAGKRWMVRQSKLLEYVEMLETKQEMVREVRCQLARKKIAPITTQGSVSAESECRNLRKQLLEQKRKNMKKNDEKI